MAQTFSRLYLSQDSYGAGILLPYGSSVASASAIHFPGTNEAFTDEVWIYAVNVNSTSDVTVTVNWAWVDNITNPGSQIKATLGKGKGLTLIVPGLIIKGRSNNHGIKMYASIAGSVVVHGYVNHVVVT